MKVNSDLYTYEIYTDGSAKGSDAKHKAGGWAYLVLYDGDIITKDSGRVLDTTNQAMELTACLEALKMTEKLDAKNGKGKYIIYSDSAYLINCYKDEWWKNWEKNQYRNTKKQEIANLDLWLPIIEFFKNRRYEFEKVKGHADNKYNNIVDGMAQSAATVI